MSMDDANRVIRGLVRQVMGMPAGSVRPADQIIPAGAQGVEIATVKVISAADAGWGVVTTEDIDAITSQEHVTATRRIVASVQFFRGPVKDQAGIAKYSNAAFDRASRLAQRLHLSAFTDVMERSGLGFLGASPARNLAALADATWESRAQVDLTFNYANRESAPVETILSVPVQISVQQPDGADEQTRTFEVTT